MALSELDRRALMAVMERGDLLEKWRAGRLLGRVEPVPPPGWAAAQNPDGGWRSREHRSPVSNMGTTSVMLMRMAFMGLGDTEECRRTVDFLWRTQQPDGRWTEDPAQWDGNPPEWNRPGDLEVDLWETANNAAALTALGYRGDERVGRAIAFVRGNAREDGTVPGYLAATQAMASVRYAREGPEAAAPHLQACLRVLRERRERLDTMDLVWGLMLWWLGGVPRDHETVAAYLTALEERRNPDGTWPTAYPVAAMQYTVEALELLRIYGQK